MPISVEADIDNELHIAIETGYDLAKGHWCVEFLWWNDRTGDRLHFQDYFGDKGCMVHAIDAMRRRLSKLRSLAVREGKGSWDVMSNDRGGLQDRLLTSGADET